MKDQEETENMEEPRIDKTIYTGRPENTEGRLEKEIAVYDFLDSLGIEYKRVDHEALMTMEACEEVDHLLEAKICKNLFLCNRQKTDFYLLLMPGRSRLKRNSCPNRSEQPDFLLQMESRWRNISTLHRGH